MSSKYALKNSAAESTTMTGPTSNMEHNIEETLSTFVESTTWPSGDSGASSSELSQAILIILGLFLAVLVLVCCILACIFARMRRGFCTMDGKNQARCDDDCQGDEMSLRPTPKDSLTSAKIPNCRSSDKLLE